MCKAEALAHNGLVASHSEFLLQSANLDKVKEQVEVMNKMEDYSTGVGGFSAI